MCMEQEPLTLLGQFIYFYDTSIYMPNLTTAKRHYLHSLRFLCLLSKNLSLRSIIKSGHIRDRVHSLRACLFQTPHDT